MTLAGATNSCHVEGMFWTWMDGRCACMQQFPCAEEQNNVGMHANKTVLNEVLVKLLIQFLFYVHNNKSWIPWTCARNQQAERERDLMLYCTAVFWVKYDNFVMWFHWCQNNETLKELKNLLKKPILQELLTRLTQDLASRFSCSRLKYWAKGRRHFFLLKMGRKCRQLWALNSHHCFWLIQWWIYTGPP